MTTDAPDPFTDLMRLAAQSDAQFARNAIAGSDLLRDNDEADEDDEHDEIGTLVHLDDDDEALNGEIPEPHGNLDADAPEPQVDPARNPANHPHLRVADHTGDEMLVIDVRRMPADNPEINVPVAFVMVTGPRGVELTREGILAMRAWIDARLADPNVK